MAHSASEPDVRWVFGYGSLVYRPAFPYVDRAVGRLDGWQRRFWQGSTDHRGVPGAPGRVATLIESPGASVHGMAYRIADAERDAILSDLDYREKDGYQRALMPVHLSHQTIEALVYWADSTNPQYLGPASIDEMVAQILRSHGPSGPNTDYVLQLDSTLTSLGVDDPDLRALAQAVRKAADRARPGL
ncbi:MAG: gamma-glutamylcyclotransferase [Myxococcota bacterium]